MPTFVKNPPECVNYSKLVRLAAIIEEITRFQNPRYQIEADGTVRCASGLGEVALLAVANGLRSAVGAVCVLVIFALTTFTS